MNVSSRASFRLPVASDWSGPPLEFIKWLALVLMVIDHVNKYVFMGAVPELFALGRVSMPLFVFSLACNLASTDSLSSGRFHRVFGRLLFFGVLASLPFTLLQPYAGGHWWPFNMMITLLVAVACAWLFAAGGSTRYILACLLFVFGGLLGEYWWPAIVLFLCVWSYFRSPSIWWLAGVSLAASSLWLINQNHWALLAIPVVVLSRFWVLPLPRARNFFYWFYPLHFAVLLIYLQFSSS